MTAPGLQPGEPSSNLASIGAVLARLKQDFPDVSISKIRFLESEGLVTPVRTPAGYRQFGPADVERLRFVLAAQRDHYLPLKVIKEQLEALDRGEGGSAPASLRLPRTLAVAESTAPPAEAPLRLTRTELLSRTGLTTSVLREIEQAGLVTPVNGGWYDHDAVQIALTVVELLEAGLEPRHLRQFRGAADREATLAGQLVAAQARQRDPDARERAQSQAQQVATTMVTLHGLLLQSALRRDLGH